MTQEEANKMILDMWSKERLAEEWVREHIKYNELKQENEKLKELCNKYEEEHNTTFKEWQKNIQANKKAIEYIRTQQTIFKDYDIVIEKQLKNISNILEGNNEYNKQ